MVNDANPEVITRAEALARVNKAAQSCGVVIGQIRFVGDRGRLSTDPDLREMRLQLNVKGNSEREIHASFGALQDAVDRTDGVQLIAHERDGHGLPGSLATVVYYAKNTGEF